MSDEEPENAAERPDEEKPKGKMGVIVVAILVMVSAAAGFAVPTILNAKPDEKKKDDTLTMDLPEPTGKPGFVSFGETVANLNDGRMTRYLRLGVTMQVDEAQVTAIEELYTKREAVLKNWLLSHISDKSMDDIRGASGQNRLRREIQEQFNTVLFPDGIDRIQDVLFEEFNVQ